jgi:hypothetical protein
MFTTAGVTVLTNGANVGIEDARGGAAVNAAEKPMIHAAMIAPQACRIVMQETPYSFQRKVKF